MSEFRETKISPSKRFFIFNFLKFSWSKKVPSIILKGLSEIGVRLLLKMQASRKFWSFLKWMFLRHSTDFAKLFNIVLVGNWDSCADPISPPQPTRKSNFHFSLIFLVRGSHPHF